MKTLKELWNSTNEQICRVPDGYLEYITKIAKNDAVFQDGETDLETPHKIEHFLAKTMLEVLHKNGGGKTSEVWKICNEFQWSGISHNLLRAIWNMNATSQTRHSHLFLEKIMSVNGISLDNMEVFAYTNIHRKYIIPKAILKTLEIARYCDEIERGRDISGLFFDQTSFEFWQKRLVDFIKENKSSDLLGNFLSMLLDKISGREREILIGMILSVNVLHLEHFEQVSHGWQNDDFLTTERVLFKVHEVAKHCNQVNRGFAIAQKIANGGAYSWRAMKHEIYGS